MCALSLSLWYRTVLYLPGFCVSILISCLGFLIINPRSVLSLFCPNRYFSCLSKCSSFSSMFSLILTSGSLSWLVLVCFKLQTPNNNISMCSSQNLLISFSSVASLISISGSLSKLVLVCLFNKTWLTLLICVLLKIY